MRSPSPSPTRPTTPTTEDGSDDEEVGKKEEDDGGISSDVLKNISSFGSFTGWCRSIKWRNGRNEHEVEALAAAIDSLSNGDIEEAKEIMICRLVGVHEAETGHGWAMAEALQHQVVLFYLLIVYERLFVLLML